MADVDDVWTPEELYGTINDLFDERGCVCNNCACKVWAAMVSFTDNRVWNHVPVSAVLIMEAQGEYADIMAEAVKCVQDERVEAKVDAIQKHAKRVEDARWN